MARLGIIAGSAAGPVGIVVGGLVGVGLGVLYAWLKDDKPNFYDPGEDCNDDTQIIGFFKNAFCRIGHSQSEIAKGYRELTGLKPALIDVDPVLLSRSCETNTAKTKRTCRETWSENIILLKNRLYATKLGRRVRIFVTG